jgi:hypothetical protein
VQIISIWRGATDRTSKPTGEQNGGSRTLPMLVLHGCCVNAM